MLVCQRRIHHLYTIFGIFAIVPILTKDLQKTKKESKTLLNYYEKHTTPPFPAMSNVGITELGSYPDHRHDTMLSGYFTLPPPYALTCIYVCRQCGLRRKSDGLFALSDNSSFFCRAIPAPQSGHVPVYMGSRFCKEYPLCKKN